MRQVKAANSYLRVLFVFFFCAAIIFGAKIRVWAITVNVSEVEAADSAPLYHITKGTSESLTFQLPVEEEYVTGEDGQEYSQFVYPELVKVTSSKPSIASYDDGTVTGCSEGTSTIKITYRYAFSTGTEKTSVSIKIRVVAYSRSGNTLTIDASQISNGNITYSLQEAAAVARDNATKDAPYVIRIPAGKYTLSGQINLYSNVTVEMDAETVITVTIPTGSNVFFLGTTGGTYQGQANYNTSKACAGYGGFENVTIRGGTIIGNSKSTSCLVRMAHATNVTFDGVTFSGGGAKHQVEFAAIDGLAVKNCVFKDFYGVSGDQITSEALQLDIPTSQTNYPGTYEDGTPLKNVEISGCTFQNLSKGIGTHSMLVGAYHTNIKINDNVFSNITYGAITCLNYYNCEIKDNVMKNCGAGIDFSYYLPSYLSAANCVYTTTFDGKTAYKKSIKHNAQTVISGNKMTITYRVGTIETAGIKVYGYNRTTAVKGADGKDVKAKNYYVSGVTVADNVIVTAGYGIHLSDARNCTITDNTITGKKFSANDAHIKSGYTYDGIYLTDKSTASALSGNTICKMNGGGIYLSKSVALGGICNNKIAGVKRYGIYLYAGSRAKVGITGNTIKSTSAAEALIYLDTSSKIRHVISNNTLKGYKTNAAIKVDNGRFTISDNTISRVSDGVVLSDAATGDIYANTCSSKKASRVRFSDKSYYMLRKITQSTAKASKKGKITPELPAIKDVDGYEIQVSDSKNFDADVLVYRLKAADTAPVISGLTAKKKYYVRTYAYKTYKDVRIYLNN
jgi:parallel beta-helix repeat protein